MSGPGYVKESKYLQVLAERETLAARIAELELALRRYGDHDKGCAYNNPYSPPKGFNRRPCSCGFEAALAAAPTEGSAMDRRDDNG